MDEGELIMPQETKKPDTEETQTDDGEKLSSKDIEKKIEEATKLKKKLEDQQKNLNEKEKGVNSMLAKFKDLFGGKKGDDEDNDDDNDDNDDNNNDDDNKPEKSKETKKLKSYLKKLEEKISELDSKLEQTNLQGEMRKLHKKLKIEDNSNAQNYLEFLLDKKAQEKGEGEELENEDIDEVMEEMKKMFKKSDKGEEKVEPSSITLGEKGVFTDTVSEKSHTVQDFENMDINERSVLFKTAPELYKRLNREYLKRQNIDGYE